MQTTDAPTPSSALGCLVFIGRYYGLSLSVDGLLQDNRLSPGEATTEQLLTAAQRAGFRCTSLVTKWAAVLELKKALPAIVRLHGGQSVILLRIEDRGGVPGVVLQDPEAETPADPLSRAGFEEIWTGEIVLIKRSQGAREEVRPFGLEMLWSMLRGQGPLVRDLVVSSLAMSLLALVPILFAQLMVSYVLAVPATATFVFLCCAVVLLIGFEAGFTALRGSIVARLGNRLDLDLSDLVVARVFDLPLGYFETTPQGLVAHRLGKVAAIRTLLSGRMIGAVLDIGLLAVFVPVMMYLSPVLTFVVLGWGVLLGLWVLITLPKVRAATAAVEAVEAERAAFLSESLRAARLIRSLALDARQRHKWDVLTARVTRLRLAESEVLNLVQTVATPIERLMVFGTFAFGIYLAYSTTASGLSLGLLFGFLLMTRRLAEPVARLATLIRQYDETRSAIAGLASVIDLPAETGRSGHGVRLPLRGQIEFSNVRFEYEGAGAPALQAISFDVPVGTTLGIMGRSGSGKTTITRLLQKLESDYQGLIKIDGIDAREYDVDHLRRSLGVVQQESFLFAGTIRDNIVAGKRDASDDEMTFAARLAGADEFIARLPLGYDTMLDEGAPDLSEGQRQRIAIARVLITDPQILIFDEATSALDAESEAIVAGNLKRIASGRTMITISHRLSALVNADAILVLDRGEVQDIGRHQELLERCDIYSGTWQRQRAEIGGPAADEKLLPRSSHVA